MSMSDPLGDMLTRIRNAQSAKKKEVISPASRLRESVLEVLKKKVTFSVTKNTTFVPALTNFAFS